MRKRKSRKFPVFTSRRECEKHPLVREEIQNSPLDYRIPIFWFENDKADTADRKTLHKFGTDVLGSPNNLLGRLRSIAKTPARPAVYWIPINACTAKSRKWAEKVYKSNRDYSKASNKARQVGKVTMSVKKFIEDVAKSKRGGQCAFYCIEINDGKKREWKIGIASNKEAAGRRRVHRHKDARWHCLITDLASMGVARDLEKKAQATFGDICCVLENDPKIRLLYEYFRDVPRIRKAAKLLRPLTERNLPEKFKQYFAKAC